MKHVTTSQAIPGASLVLIALTLTVSLALAVSLTPAVSLTLAFAADSDPLVLEWDDLRYKSTIEDPFKTMTHEQLLDLSNYEYASSMQKTMPQAVSEKMLTEAHEAKARLTQQGIDVDDVLAQREEIKKLRRRRKTSTNPEIDGREVRIPGYMLPLEYDGKKVTEFLLVPWVGACIHTPAPAPNQIVYVSMKQPFAVRDQFEPVWITGEITIDDVLKDLFLVDGAAEISIGYMMIHADVERYEELAQQAVPRRGDAH